MSWQEDKSIKRIFNTFKRLKNQIFNEDIEALKTLNESVKNNAKVNVDDNLLYAKLLAVHLRQTFEYFGDMQTSIKKINDELQMPLESHLQFLHKKLNETDFNNYLLSLNIKVDFKSLEDLENNKLNIKENQKEIANKIKNSWSYENVEKSFYNTANTFLKDVNNYK